MDNIVLGIILLLAGVFVCRNFVKIFKGKGGCSCASGCGCSSGKIGEKSCCSEHVK